MSHHHIVYDKPLPCHPGFWTLPLHVSGDNCVLGGCCLKHGGSASIPLDQGNEEGCIEPGRKHRRILSKRGDERLLEKVLALGCLSWTTWTTWRAGLLKAPPAVPEQTRNCTLTSLAARKVWCWAARRPLCSRWSFFLSFMPTKFNSPGCWRLKSEL